MKYSIDCLLTEIASLKMWREYTPEESRLKARKGMSDTNIDAYIAELHRAIRILNKQVDQDKVVDKIILRHKADE